MRDLHRVTLPNGLETIIIRRPGASVVTAALGVHGGSDSAALGVGAASRYAMKMYFEESPGDFGIEVGFGAHWDLSTISATAGAGNLDRALEMVVFALRSYDVEWPSDKFQDTILPFLRRQESGSVGRFEHSYRDALFHGHPAGRPTGDQIAATKKARDRQLARAGVQSQECAAGDRRRCRSDSRSRRRRAKRSRAGNRLAESLHRRFRSLRRRRRPPVVVPSTVRAGFLIVHRPGATQVLLRMGCLLPPSDARTDAVRDVAAGIVQDRLQTVLRRQLGSTYGVQVGADARRGAGAVLEISAAFDNASFSAAWSELHGVVDSSAWATLATPESVALAAGGLASARLRGNERSATLAAAVLDAWNAGWPLDSPDQYIGYLASITPDEVNATLARCAAGTEVALLGDESTIRAATGSLAHR